MSNIEQGPEKPTPEQAQAVINGLITLAGYPIKPVYESNFDRVYESRDFELSEIVERIPATLAEELEGEMTIDLTSLEDNHDVHDILINNSGYYDDEIEEYLDQHHAIIALYKQAKDQTDSGKSASDELSTQIKARRTVAIRVFLEDKKEQYEFDSQMDGTTPPKGGATIHKLDDKRRAA